jgi:hypothetical protein
LQKYVSKRVAPTALRDGHMEFFWILLRFNRQRIHARRMKNKISKVKTYGRLRIDAGRVGMGEAAEAARAN